MKKQSSVKKELTLEETIQKVLEKQNDVLISNPQLKNLILEELARKKPKLNSFYLSHILSEMCEKKILRRRQVPYSALVEMSEKGLIKSPLPKPRGGVFRILEVLKND